MKRYIYCSSASDLDIFKMDTDTSYYNNFLNEKDSAYMQKAKNRRGEVVYMTPAQYYQECADNIFGEGVTVARLKQQRGANAELVHKYEQDMLAGDKFPLCYLNYADASQEGLHRMMAAGNVYGWDAKFPVLLVHVVDKRREELNDIWRFFNDAVYDAQDVTYDADTWEQDFVEEVEFNLEHDTGKHHKVVITSRRDLEECAKYNMDYAIEIALADFQDIMHSITVFEPKLRKPEDSENKDSDKVDLDDLDLDDLDDDLFIL